MSWHFSRIELGTLRTRRGSTNWSKVWVPRIPRIPRNTSLLLFPGKSTDKRTKELNIRHKFRCLYAAQYTLFSQVAKLWYFKLWLFDPTEIKAWNSAYVYIIKGWINYMKLKIGTSCASFLTIFHHPFSSVKMLKIFAETRNFYRKIMKGFQSLRFIW